MDDFNIGLGIFFGCLFTMLITIIVIGLAYDDRIKNLELEISFMKLDLSCERSPLENMFVNYLDYVRHDSLLKKINEWYLRECI